ncbi:MAG TPA: sodium:solute symporter family protein [Verrucomicrobiae bacterium]|nr:sodium:solute symporter family protein [Verrucomicrobiae bacterium]
MGTHTYIVIGLLIYGCLMLAMSSFWMFRVRKAVDYLVAGRNLPYWILAGTITAGCIGTGVVIGGSGIAYQFGWAGSAYPLGLGLGTVLTGFFFAHTRRYKFITLSEEISCYYNNHRAITEFCNVSLFLSQLCWLTVQITGCGHVLGIVTGWRPELCIVLAGFVTALIAIPGGFRTVVYTDFLNAIILLTGFGFLFHSALHHSGGFSGLRQSVPPENFSFLGHEAFGNLKLISLLLVLILSDVADPGRRLAIYSARTPAIAKWSMVTAGTVVMIFSVVIGIIGMYAFSINPNLPKEQADQTFPWLVVHVLPPALAAIVVVAATAAILSCANSNAAAVGTFFVRHIFPLATRRYPQNPVRVARWTLVFAFIISTAFALHTTSIVGFVVKFLPVTMSGLAVIILIGRFWKRANWQGALAALIATPVVSLAVILIPSLTRFWGYPAIPAIVAGGLAQTIVSLLTPPQQSSFAEIAEKMTREREIIEGNPPEPPKLKSPAQNLEDVATV